MTERRRSSFDGHELLLVATHRQATIMQVLLTLAGASSVLGLVLALTFVPDRDARGTALGVVLAVVLTGLFVTVSVVWVRRQPVPSLRVRTDGIEARSYGLRLQVPWHEVRSVGRWQTPLGDLHFAVDVDPAYWDRVGVRWHEKRVGGVHGASLDVSHMVTFPVPDMPLAEALRHTRRIAPESVPVASSGSPGVGPGDGLRQDGAT